MNAKETSVQLADSAGGGAGPATSPATTAAGPRPFPNPVLAGNFAWERLDDALSELPEWSVLEKGLTWAPEVARTLAGFVLYYTLRDAASGRQCISAAVADRPEGPFRDTRSRPLVCHARLGGSIDPHRFVERDGIAYLLWKNDGNCCGMATELWAQRLHGDGLRLAGKPASLGVRNDAAWEGNLIEAPTLWREGDTYYLFYSANDYGSPDCAVGYATATKALGPYRDSPGNPILRSRGKAGGQRSMWLDRLSFENGRPRAEGPTDIPQEAP